MIFHDGFGFMFGFLGVLSLAGLVLVIWALVDCLKVTNDAQYQSGTKLIWVLVIVLLWGLGAIIYLLIGRPTGKASSVRSERSPSAMPPASSDGLPPPPPGSIP